MAARKTKVTSTTGKIQLMERLQTKITSPIAMTQEEEAVFDGIIAGLPQDTWETFRIRLAANLAKMVVRAERLMKQLDEEGDTVINAKGTPVMNPINNAMQQSFASVQTITRTLGLSASQRGISESTTKAGKAAEKEAKAVIEKSSKTSLL